MAALVAQGPEARLALRACPHTATTLLGSEANARFARCSACGRLLVLQGDRAWTVLGAGPKL